MTITREVVELVKAHPQAVADAADAAKAIAEFEAEEKARRTASGTALRKLREVAAAADARVQRSAAARQQLEREMPTDARDAVGQAGIDLRALEQQRRDFLGRHLASKDFLARMLKVDQPHSAVESVKAQAARDEKALAEHDKKIDAAKKKLEKARVLEEKAFEEVLRAAEGRFPAEGKKPARAR